MNTQPKRLSGALSLCVWLFWVSTAAPASAQISSVIADVQSHGLQLISCRSVVIAFHDKDTTIANLVTGWIDGYVQGVGAALMSSTLDTRTFLASEEAKSPAEHELGLHLAAIMVSVFSGNPNIVARASMATRRSELDDYCQQHSTDTLQGAAGSLLNTSWLKLPSLKSQ